MPRRNSTATFQSSGAGLTVARTNGVINYNLNSGGVIDDLMPTTACTSSQKLSWNKTTKKFSCVTDKDTTYDLTESGNQICLVPSSGSNDCVTDTDTTYTAGTGININNTTHVISTTGGGCIVRISGNYTISSNGVTSAGTSGCYSSGGETFGAGYLYDGAVMIPIVAGVSSTGTVQLKAAAPPSGAGGTTSGSVYATIQIP
jgi:hypothetical protein